MVGETHNRQRRGGDAENTRGDRDVYFAANPFGFDGNLSLFRPRTPVPPETEDVPEEVEDEEAFASGESDAVPAAEETGAAPSKGHDEATTGTVEKTARVPEPVVETEPVGRKADAPAENTQSARDEADSPVAEAEPARRKADGPQTAKDDAAAFQAPVAEPAPARREEQRAAERPEVAQEPEAQREPAVSSPSEVVQAPKKTQSAAPLPSDAPQDSRRPAGPVVQPQTQRLVDEPERPVEPVQPVDRPDSVRPRQQEPVGERKPEVTRGAPKHARKADETGEAPVTFQMADGTRDLGKPVDIKPVASAPARFRFDSDEKLPEAEANSMESYGAFDAIVEEEEEDSGWLSKVKKLAFGHAKEEEEEKKKHPLDDLDPSLVQLVDDRGPVTFSFEEDSEEEDVSPRTSKKPTRRVGAAATEEQAPQEKQPARPTRRVGARTDEGGTTQERPLRPTRRVGRAADLDGRVDHAARERARFVDAGVPSIDETKSSTRSASETEQFSLNDFGDASASALEAAFSAGRSAIEPSASETGQAAKTGGFKRLRGMVRRRGAGRDKMNEDLEELYPNDVNPFAEFNPFREESDFPGAGDARLETEKQGEEPSRPSAAAARRSRSRDEESRSKRSRSHGRRRSRSRESLQAPPSEPMKFDWLHEGDETDSAATSSKPIPSSQTLDELKPVRPATPKRDYPTSISKPVDQEQTAIVSESVKQTPSRDYYTGVSTTVKSDVRNATDRVRQEPSSTMNLKIPPAASPLAHEQQVSPARIDTASVPVRTDTVRPAAGPEPVATKTSPATQPAPEGREASRPAASGDRRDTSDGSKEALASLVGEPAADGYDVFKSGKSGSMSFEERLTQSFQQREDEVAAKNARIRRVAAIVVFVAAVGALTMALVMFLRPETPPGIASSESTPIELPPTTVVYRGEFRNAVYSSGVAAPQSTTPVTSPVDGTIDTLLVSEGSDVAQGDVLFTVHNDAIEQAMKSAQTSVDTATKNVDSTTIELVNATETYERTYNFFASLGDFTGFDEQGLISKVNAADSAHIAAMDELARAKDALVAAQAEDDKRIVRAPMTGNVVSLTASMGMQVTSSELAPGAEALLELADLSQMKVVASFREEDVPNLHEGQLVELNFQSMSGSLMYGTVMNIATTPTAADGAYGSEQTWAVDIAVTTPDHNLKPGMVADVTVLLQQVPDTLIVPASAVWEEMGSDGQSRHYVLVLTSSSTGATRKAEVAVSAVNDTEAAVWGELTEGDLVVTNPTFASESPA